MAKDKEYLNNKRSQLKGRGGYSPLNLSPPLFSVNLVGMVRNVSYLPSGLLYESLSFLLAKSLSYLFDWAIR